MDRLRLATLGVVLVAGAAHRSSYERIEDDLLLLDVLFLDDAERNQNIEVIELRALPEMLFDESLKQKVMPTFYRRHYRDLEYPRGGRKSELRRQRAAVQRGYLNR